MPIAREVWITLFLGSLSCCSNLCQWPLIFAKIFVNKALLEFRPLINPFISENPWNVKIFWPILFFSEKSSFRDFYCVELVTCGIYAFTWCFWRFELLVVLPEVEDISFRGSDSNWKMVLLHDLSNTILLEGEIGDEIKIMANPSPSINSWGGQHRTKSQGTEKSLILDLSWWWC